jgi:hypothetical protein
MNLHKLLTGTESILETEKITVWLPIDEETLPRVLFDLNDNGSSSLLPIGYEGSGPQ